MKQLTADVLCYTIGGNMKRINIQKLKSYEKDGVTIFPVIASSEAIDRDNESILASAWDLKSYQEHPIIMANHDYYGGTDSQVGEALSIKKGEDSLQVEVMYYNGKGNDRADWCYFLASQNMAAYSVGFMPKQWTSDRNDLVYQNWVEQYGEKTPDRIYTNVELLELSHVAIPSLREALQQNSALKLDAALAVGKSIYPEEAEYLEWVKSGRKSYIIPLIERLEKLEKAVYKPQKEATEEELLAELFGLKS